MKLFVTGGAGFIGSNYVRHVLANTDDRRHRLRRPHLRRQPGQPRGRARRRPPLPFVQGDICDPTAARGAMPGHDAVVHFAAESHVDRSIVDPDDFVRTNCFGTNVVM
jgi:dTDP-glucose 4,6-dehydratase